MAANALCAALFQFLPDKRNELDVFRKNIRWNCYVCTVFDDYPASWKLPHFVRASQSKHAKFGYIFSV